MSQRTRQRRKMGSCEGIRERAQQLLIKIRREVEG